MQSVLRIGFAMTLAGLLPSCFGVQAPAVRQAGPVALHYNFAQVRHLVEPTAAPLTVGTLTALKGAVPVRGFHEPGDYAHRNYCGAGATQVLLSAWMPNVPNIETVARASRLNPNRGEYGIDAVNAINGFLNPIVLPVLNQPRYQADHVVSLDEVKARIQRDILDQQAIVSFGHGVPVMVQTMTVKALWVAMQAYLREAAYDPMNVIS